MLISIVVSVMPISPTRPAPQVNSTLRYHPPAAILVGSDVKTKTYFAFRVDVWDGAGDNIVEHVAGVDDFETAVATYWAAVRRWPKAKITLRQGVRIVHRNWQE
jgi:hypothetical protein